MVRAIILGAMVLVATAAMSDERQWEPMSGAQITQTLTGQTVDYASAWQDFRASGRTLYNTGHDNWGYWAVRSDQYCSTWPPNDLWACYSMERRGNEVRFIGASDDITTGVVRD